MKPASRRASRLVQIEEWARPARTSLRSMLPRVNSRLRAGGLRISETGR